MKTCKKCPRPENLGGDPNCKDEHDECPQWQALGECEKNPRYMDVHCMKTCQKCLSANGAMEGGAGGDCQDEHAECPQWQVIRYSDL